MPGWSLSSLPLESQGFLETNRIERPKTSWEVKTAVRAAAAGAHSRGRPVVVWDADGRRLPGPSVKSYERVRKPAFAGAHLVQTLFWMVQRLCLPNADARSYASDRSWRDYLSHEVHSLALC